MSNTKALDFKETKLGFTIGDANGVGMETMLRAFASPYLFNHCTPVLYGSAEVFTYYCKALGLPDMRYNLITDTADCLPDQINLKQVGGADLEVNPGTPSAESGALALEALNAAIADVKSGQIENLVTLPIDKSTIQSDTFDFAGHTDFLAKSFEVEDYMMILTSDDLRVGVVTGHIPITRVAQSLSQELIEQKIQILLDSLRFDFGVVKPKIAVLGLNPHSGDNGLIGKEETDIIKPAIDTFINQGILVFGPYSADGFFGTQAYKQFDAVLAMYHDQGLIPFKQISFHNGVNYTAGLPIVRTSPDHGTAYDIAGKGTADITSLVSAVFEAKTIYLNRLESNALNKSPLGFKTHRREKFSIGVPNLK
ncbi:MAG: 4-hydroxythreonine-4-phosphate dehydrogenase [Bacteroidia bacterium]